jgi:hypothetical protein
VCSVSLVSLNFQGKTFQKHHTIEPCSVDYYVFVNTFEPTEFLLDVSTPNQCRYQFCTVVKDKIVVGELIELDFFCHYYFDGRIFGLIWVQDDDFVGYRLQR